MQEVREVQEVLVVQEVQVVVLAQGMPEVKEVQVVQEVQEGVTHVAPPTPGVVGHRPVKNRASLTLQLRCRSCHC